MTPKVHHKQISAENQEAIRDLLQEKLKLAVRYTLVATLEEEVEAYIQAGPYERAAHRQDQRNGRYTRNRGTALGEIEDLPVPRTRKGFRSQLFERYKRRQAELDESICEMFVYGVSTEKVGHVLETLSGSHPINQSSYSPGSFPSKEQGAICLFQGRFVRNEREQPAPLFSCKGYPYI